MAVRFEESEVKKAVGHWCAVGKPKLPSSLLGLESRSEGPDEGEAFLIGTLVRGLVAEMSEEYPYLTVEFVRVWGTSPDGAVPEPPRAFRQALKAQMRLAGLTKARVQDVALIRTEHQVVEEGEGGELVTRTATTVRTEPVRQLSTSEVASILNKDESTLRRWRRLGQGPRFRREDSGRVSYDPRDVDDYVRRTRA